jgi:hypothetical protein
MQQRWMMGLVAVCLAVVMSGCQMLGLNAPKPGEKATATNPGFDKVYVCSDLADFDNVSSTLNRRHDATAQKEMTADGKVFLLPNGAHVKVLDIKSQPSASQVEFLDGPGKGRRGWVHTSWLSKS